MLAVTAKLSEVAPGWRNINLFCMRQYGPQGRAGMDEHILRVTANDRSDDMGIKVICRRVCPAVLGLLRE